MPSPSVSASSSNLAPRRRFQEVATFVANADSTYQNHARAGTLYQLAVETDVDGRVSTDEMKVLYESRMVRQGTPGRDIYDALLANAPRGLCPLCADRTADTLDHHLPKRSFPSLAVAPANLIPACGKCNKVKLAEVPRSG